MAPGHTRAPQVVLVTSSLQGGGAERVMSDMANFWARRGWGITLATWSGPQTEDFYALETTVCRVWLDVDTGRPSGLLKLGANLRRIRKLRKLLKDSRADAILSFIDRSNVLAIMAAFGLGTRITVSERVHAAHYSGLPWQWRVLRKIVYARAHAVVAQTKDAAAWLGAHCGTEVQVIPNPLRNLPDAVDERDLLVLAVGRLYHQKGFDLLLRAFAPIARQFKGWRVMIVGAGPEEAALLGLRDELNLTDSVDFLPPRRDVEALMARAGLVVQPSRYEGFPNVLLEAMGMGAAVISTDCPSGPAEIIRDGVNGRLVPNEDVPALRAAMVELMSQPETRRRLGHEALKIREVFRQDLIMAQWEKCILTGQVSADPVSVEGKGAPG